MPQLPQHAQRRHGPALDAGFQAAQLVGRAAQPAQLFGQHGGGERMFPGLRQDLWRLDPAGGARIGAGGNAQTPADAGLDRQIQRHAAPRPYGRVGLPQPAGQLRIVGLPHLHAGAQLIEFEVAAAEGEFHQPVGNRPVQRPALAKDAVDAAALAKVIRAVALEDDAVAALDGRGQLDPPRVPLRDAAKHAQTDTLLGRAFSGDQGLVVAAFQPAGGEAAGEGDLQFGHSAAA